MKMTNFWANAAKKIVKSPVLEGIEKVLSPPLQGVSEVLESVLDKDLVGPKRGPGVGTLIDENTFNSEFSNAVGTVVGLINSSIGTSVTKGLNSIKKEARMSLRMVFLRDTGLLDTFNMGVYIRRFVESVNSVWNYDQSGLSYMREGQIYPVTTKGVVYIDYVGKQAYDNMGNIIDTNNPDHNGQNNLYQEVPMVQRDENGYIITHPEDFWVFVGRGDSDPAIPDPYGPNASVSYVELFSDFTNELLKTHVQQGLLAADSQRWNLGLMGNRLFTFFGRVIHWGYFYENDDISRYAPHELGHIFGLSDRYVEGFSIVSSVGDAGDRGSFVGDIVSERVTMPISNPADNDLDYQPLNNLYSDWSENDSSILTPFQVDIVFRNISEQRYPKMVLVHPASPSNSSNLIARAEVVYVIGKGKRKKAVVAERDAESPGNFKPLSPNENNIFDAYRYLPFSTKMTEGVNKQKTPPSSTGLSLRLQRHKLDAFKKNFAVLTNGAGIPLKRYEKGVKRQLNKEPEEEVSQTFYDSRLPDVIRQRTVIH